MSASDTVFRWLLVTVVAGVITALTLLLLAGHGPWSGRIVWQATPNHGLNTGDVPVLAFWGVGMLACLLLLRRR